MAFKSRLEEAQAKRADLMFSEIYPDHVGEHLFAANVYPPTAPTVSGDLVSINRFLLSPTLLERRLRTISNQRFIADQLLTGRSRPSGGAIQYEQNESIFPDRISQAVAPGQEFPGTTVGVGPTVIEKVQKYGQWSLVTRESIKRQNRDPVMRATTKLANEIVRKTDTLALAKIAASGTQTLASTAAWATTTTDILFNIMTAISMIQQLNQGFMASDIVINDATYVSLMSNTNIRSAMAREDQGNPVYSGMMGRISGINIMVSPNLPTAATALVLDRSVLGGIADEDNAGVNADSQYEKEIQSYRMWAWRTFTPYVNEPLAAVTITGV